MKPDQPTFDQSASIARESGDARQSVHRSLARATGFSIDAVEAMQRALAASGGRMAQFDHPEFGGLGQWMQGGMVMTSSGRDTVLEGRIDSLCAALDRAAATDGGSTPPRDDADSPRPPNERVVSGTDQAEAIDARPASSTSSTGLDPFIALEKLADLRVRGIVSDSEYAAKKTELLGRI